MIDNILGLLVLLVCFWLWSWLKNRFERTELEDEVLNAKLVWIRYLRDRLIHHQTILSGHTVTFRFQGSNEGVMEIARILDAGLSDLGVSILILEDTADRNLRFHQYSASDLYYRISDRHDNTLKEGKANHEFAVAKIINELADTFIQNP